MMGRSRSFFVSLPGLLMALPIAASEPKAGVVEVHAIGRLSFTGIKEKGASEWTHFYYIEPENQRIMLDISQNPDALKTLKEKSGSHPSEWSSDVLPIRTIKVKGRLKFRPGMNPVPPPRAGETPALIPVIVVEILVIPEE